MSQPTPDISIEREVLGLLLPESKALHPEDRSPSVVWEKSWPKLWASFLPDDIDKWHDGLRNILDPNWPSNHPREFQRLNGLIAFLRLAHSDAKEVQEKVEHGSSDGISSIEGVTDLDEGVGFDEDTCVQTVDHSVKIEHLPDELLMRIMALACSRHTSCMNIMREMLDLSHVSRRFRSIALDVSERWAGISSLRMASPSLAETLLARSKSVTLHVHMDFSWGNRRLLRLFLEKMLPLMHRWKELHITGGRYSEMQASALWELFAGLDLPNLERFGYYYRPSMSSHEPLSADLYPNDKHIYSSWIMPNLREIYFETLVPQPLLGSSVSVVHMEFGLTPSLSEALYKFHSFLQSTPTTETLILSGLYLQFQDLGSVQDPKHLKGLSMENIRTVEIYCDFSTAQIPEERNYSESAFCCFMQSLQMPKLHDLLMSVDLDFGWVDPGNPLDNLSDLVLALVPSSSSQPSTVQNLDLRIRGQTTRDGDRTCNSFIAIPFDRLPALQNITVHIAGILGAPRLLSGDVAPSFPLLEHITVSKCWGGALPFLRNVIDNVRWANGMQRKVSVSVDNCSYVEKEELLEFVAEEDLEFQRCELTKGMEDPKESYYGYIPHPSELPALLSSIGFDYVED